MSLSGSVILSSMPLVRNRASYLRYLDTLIRYRVSEIRYLRYDTSYGEQPMSISLRYYLTSIPIRRGLQVHDE